MPIATKLSRLKNKLDIGSRMSSMMNYFSKGASSVKKSASERASRKNEAHLEDLLLGTIMSMDTLNAISGTTYFVDRRLRYNPFHTIRKEIQVDDGARKTWQNPISLLIDGNCVQVAPFTVGELYVDRKDVAYMPPQPAGIETIVAQDHGYANVIDAAIRRAMDLHYKREQQAKQALPKAGVATLNFVNGLKPIVDAKQKRDFAEYQRLLGQLVASGITDLSKTTVHVDNAIANFLDLFYEAQLHAKLEREQEKDYGFPDHDARDFYAKLKKIHGSTRWYRLKNRLTRGVNTANPVSQPMTPKDLQFLAHYDIGRTYLA